jgi:hypothetical protein
MTPTEKDNLQWAICILGISAIATIVVLSLVFGW